MVLWEMLRFHAKTYPNEKLIRNALGVDIAVWSDAFEAESSINYEDNQTLTVAQQKKYTWRSWFNPADTDILSKAFEGKYHQSYNEFDDALWNKMRVNDWLLRDDGEDANEIAISLSQFDDVAGILSVELNILGLAIDIWAKDAAERTASMNAALDARDDFILPIDPDVHMLRTAEINTFLVNGLRTPIGTSVGGNTSNSLAREVPPLLIIDSQNVCEKPSYPGAKR